MPTKRRTPWHNKIVTHTPNLANYNGKAIGHLIHYRGFEITTWKYPSGRYQGVWIEGIGKRFENLDEAKRYIRQDEGRVFTKKPGYHMTRRK